MAVKINSNISSLTAQRYLARATESEGVAFERLSSGLRINKASDDAAGLAIGLSLDVQGRVFGQSLRNINDAISAVNIADGASQSLSDVLIRLQELAEQSANGSFSNTQRTAIDTEGQALRNEYNRIIQVTSFNGIRLLDGSSQNLRIQAGTTDLSYGLSLDPTINTRANAYIGDGTFQTSPSLGGFISINDVEAGDVNGDGKADIIISDASTIKIQYGNGDGTFRGQISYSLGGSGEFINLVDVNGDSFLDIIGANRGAATVSVLVNNGDGTYKARTIASGGSETEDVIGASISGDSYMDLISVSSTEATISVHVGNNDGTFKARVSYSAGTAPGSAPYTVRVGDLNGDGVTDLVVDQGPQDVFNILYGNSNGTFKAPTSFVTDDYPYNIELSDVNGDGNLDVLSFDLVPTSVSIRLGNGNGTFKAAISYDVNAGNDRRFIVQDFTGDGYKDIALATGDILLGNGDGSFKAVNRITSTSNRGIAIADFDGDYSYDILLNNSTAVFTALGNDDTAARALLGNFSLATRTDALSALDSFKSTLEQVSYSRGRLGAQQSRLSAASRVISATRENYGAAKSRIMDSDVAQESAELVRTSILKQSGTSILAQANQLPALALSLLR